MKMHVKISFAKMAAILSSGRWLKSMVAARYASDITIKYCRQFWLLQYVKHLIGMNYLISKITSIRLVSDKLEPV